MADATAAATPPAHETADVNGRRIWIVAGALALTIMGAALLGFGALHAFGYETGRPLGFINPTPTHAPTPSLQSAPTTDLRALRTEKHALLDEYRWIDRDKGIVRIPIERAMALLIARTSPAAQ